MNGDTSFYFLTQKEFPQTINFISTSGNNNNNNINELISYPPNQSQTFREENQTSTPFSQFQGK